MEAIKTCNICSTSKPITEYKKKYLFCKDCHNKKRRERRKLIKEKQLQPLKQPYKENFKICSKCSVESIQTKKETVLFSSLKSRENSRG